MKKPTRTCSSLKGGILGYTVVMLEDLSQSLSFSPRWLRVEVGGLPSWV